MQKGVMVEVLLDSGITWLIMSSEFARKMRFKLKNIQRPIYVRNVNRILNKKRPIEYTVEINIYYQRYRERTEINVIKRHKQKVILEIPQLACHNPKIDSKIGEMKITRYPEECKKQWRPKQGKPEQQKQKEEEMKEEDEMK